MMSFEEIDRLQWDDWYDRAVQAQFVLSSLRGVPNISVDRLLGVPEEVLQAEEEEFRKKVVELEKKRKFGTAEHRKRGEKGPVDPLQKAQFEEELGRAKFEAATKDMQGIPREMLDEVDFTLPGELYKPESLLRKPGGK